MRALAATAVLAVAVLSGCSPGSADTNGPAPASSSEPEPTVAAEHVRATVAALPDLTAKPLAAQRKQFEGSLSSTGMTVTWGRRTAVVTDHKRMCVSTFDLATSDLTRLKCGSITYTQAQVEDLLFSALAPGAAR